MAVSLEESSMRSSLRVARENWERWRDVFEHGTPAHTSPLLADRARFALFSREYSVSRTIRRGTRNDLRIELLEPHCLAAIQDDDTGRALGALEERLRPRFGTHHGKNRIVGVLSKVAALLKPAVFVARDQYARNGINIALGRKQSHEFSSYADYLADFEQVWNGEPGRSIRAYVTNGRAQSALEIEPRFLRRVLDVELMRWGGRAI
jgi:hypothetical protein